MFESIQISPISIALPLPSSHLVQCDLEEYKLSVVENMNKETKDIKSDGSPKFGRLLIVLFLAVLFLGFLTWLMETQFSDFGW